MDEMPLQQHMRYLIDLESYSLVYRPRQTDTDFIQYKRAEYSVEAGQQLRAQLCRRIDRSSAADREAAALTFVYLLKAPDLETRCGPGPCAQDDWFVWDKANQQTYHFSCGDQQPQGAVTGTVAATSQELDARPSARTFDLLMQMQPSAERYMVDEHITLQNKDDSTFLAEKWASDYLYHKGVFGTFEDV